jgi:hypothetical protein
MDAAERTLVLVVGAAPFDETEFTRRGLSIERYAIEEVVKHFNRSKAVVVADAAGKFGLIKECFSNLFPQAADYELAHAVIAHSLLDHAQIDAMRTTDFQKSRAKIFQIDELWNAANYISKHPSAQPAGNLQIEPYHIKLTTEQKLLLSRAFFDCERIFLEELSGGKASMYVYRVHAWLRPEWLLAGPRPLPFFVKIDDPISIEKEKECYRVYAEHFIPFNFRPNIDHKRCVRTRSLAALAGDFVDDAIPLRKCLRMGFASGVLFSLFETSLKGFRLQPVAAGNKQEDRFLSGFVRGRIGLGELPTEIIRRAGELGLSASPTNLEATIFQEAEKLSCLKGPCHGDLHSGNVMVRGGDAILIDFFSAGDGPLTADPAALEVSLMFGTDDEDDVASFEDWRTFVDHIYDAKVYTLHPPALAESQPGPSSWLRRSIRELRHILLGCSIQEQEAKLVLAAYLMRHARLGLESLNNSKLKPVAFDRHAYALVIAERIVTGLVAAAASKESS